MLFAVVAAVVSMSQVASAQVGRTVVVGPGFIARGVQGPGFAAGAVHTTFSARRGFVTSSPIGFVNGGTINAVGPLGVVQAGTINGFGRTASGATIIGPLGRTAQVGQIAGPNGTLNVIRGPNGGTVLFRSR